MEVKKIIFSHKDTLLENFRDLNKPNQDNYTGFVYMWYCKPEDMFYIGSHKGKINDDYRGSGKRFRKVFEYYGITQFERIILDFVVDESLREKEQFWLDKFKATTSDRFYNLKNSKRK